MIRELLKRGGIKRGETAHQRSISISSCVYARCNNRDENENDHYNRYCCLTRRFNTINVKNNYFHATNPISVFTTNPFRISTQLRCQIKRYSIKAYTKEEMSTLTREFPISKSSAQRKAQTIVVRWRQSQTGRQRAVDGRADSQLGEAAVAAAIPSDLHDVEHHSEYVGNWITNG